MAQKKIERLDTWPEWFTGKTINEPIFCREFLERHKLAYTENSFFTTEGRVTNEDAMRQTIYQQLEARHSLHHPSHQQRRPRGERLQGDWIYHQPVGLHARRMAEGRS